jgi:hypothetical protein
VPATKHCSLEKISYWIESLRSLRTKEPAKYWTFSSISSNFPETFALLPPPFLIGYETADWLVADEDRRDGKANAEVANTKLMIN